MSNAILLLTKMLHILKKYDRILDTETLNRCTTLVNELPTLLKNMEDQINKLQQNHYLTDQELANLFSELALTLFDYGQNIKNSKEALQKIAHYYHFKDREKLSEGRINFLANKILENNGDRYFLDSIADVFFINNSYQGITILDQTLNVIQNAFFFNDFVIDACLKHFTRKELLFYTYNDINCFSHIDLTTFKITLIPMDHIRITRESLYYWQNDHCIIASFNNDHFYEISVNQQKGRTVSVDFVKNKYPNFYGYCKFIDKHLHPQALITNALCSRYQVVIKDYETKSIYLLDYKNNQKINAYHFNEEVYYASYESNKFLLVTEEEIIIKSVENFVGKLKTPQERRFIAAKFGSLGFNTTIYILSTTKFFNNVPLIEVYEI